MTWEWNISNFYMKNNKNVLISVNISYLLDPKLYHVNMQRNKNKTII